MAEHFQFFHLNIRWTHLELKLSHVCDHNLWYLGELSEAISLSWRGYKYGSGCYLGEENKESSFVSEEALVTRRKKRLKSIDFFFSHLNFLWGGLFLLAEALHFSFEMPKDFCMSVGQFGPRVVIHPFVS